MRKILLMGLVGVLAVAGIWMWRHYQSEPEPADQLVLYGNIDIRQVHLAFNGRERIASLRAEEGDPVTEGQLLAVMETDRLEAAVDRARAQAAARAQVLAGLEAGTRIQEIRKARAEVAAAAVEAENAQRRFERQRTLASRDVQAVQTADDARTAAEAARARLAAARETLKLAVDGPREEDIRAERAKLKVSRAELELARQKLQDGYLYAPSDGVIRERLLEAGDMASPQRPVYTLALTEPLWVRVFVPEPDLGKIQPGMRATVLTDSHPEKEYPAWVGFISPTAEFTPKTVQTPQVRTSLVYQVRIHVCNPNGELKLGMPATVIIPLNQSPSSRPCGPPNA